MLTEGKQNILPTFTVIFLGMRICSVFYGRCENRTRYPAASVQLCCSFFSKALSILFSRES